jgi:hypothetical protein
MNLAQGISLLGGGFRSFRLVPWQPCYSCQRQDCELARHHTCDLHEQGGGSSSGSGSGSGSGPLLSVALHGLVWVHQPLSITESESSLQPTYVQPQYRLLRRLDAVAGFKEA